LRRGARLIGRSLRAHPRPHTLAIIGANLYALAVVGWTIVLGRITDEVIIPAFEEGRPALGTVLGACAAVLTVGAIRSVGTLSRRLFLAIAQFRTQRSWRREVVDHYIGAPLSFYQRHPRVSCSPLPDNDVETSCFSCARWRTASGRDAGVVRRRDLAFVHARARCLVLFPALAAMNQLYTRSHRGAGGHGAGAHR
jgi:ABC-type multidrug transport system fused ATPase/permease subunit